MTARLAVALGLAAAALAAVLSAALPSREVNPHAYMDQETRCAGCHRVEKSGEDWLLDPHIFKLSVVEVCQGCHPPQQMGRSHPVGMNPHRSRQVRSLPEQLPLQLTEGERDAAMTCGTCHNPHLPRFSKQKLHSRQPQYPTKPGEYLTFYLRVRGQEPRDGFTPLCRSCHRNL